MASREAARWAWCARAVFRAVTASTAAARPGDGASSLRRIFDVTESAASGGLRGCRPWVSVRRSPRDATKVDSGCGHVRARRPLASFRPAIGARGFASAAEAAPVPPAPPPLDAESSSPASGTPASSRKRVPKPRSGGPRDRRDVAGPRSSSAERLLSVGDVSDAETRAETRESTRPQTRPREKKARETHEKRVERQNARLHRRASETARRLRSKKRQSLIGIQTWIAQNPDRLDRFTTHLACRLLAQHASRAARRARDEADGVYSLRGGTLKVRVEPTRVSSAEEDTKEEEEEENVASVASRTIHGAIRRVAGEATNAHEWSRVLDGAATLARAGVTCGDATTVPVDSDSDSDSFSFATVRARNDARLGGSLDDVEKRKEKPPRRRKEALQKTTTLSEAAVWHVTARGSTFAATGSPADVVNNLKALATIAESYPGSVCASGARAIAQAAYARAVEWSDFELESASRALDRLVAFAKKEETYAVDPRMARSSFSEAEEDAASSSKEEEKPCAKKKRRRKKNKTHGPSPSPSPSDGPLGKKSFVTRHAFAEGFDATRALVRAVAAARADGTLMSVARPRGGAGNANGGVKGTDTGTLFARRRRSKPKPDDKRKEKGDDAPSAR